MTNSNTKIYVFIIGISVIAGCLIGTLNSLFVFRVVPEPKFYILPVLVLIIIGYLAAKNYILRKEHKAQQVLTNNILEEKNTLLKEIHHRVKNNLQVITSLLSLQSGFIDNKEAKSIFKYSQYRISTMAMVHEMLYHTEDLSKIHYGRYLTKLTNNLITSMVGTDHNIKCNLETNGLYLNIDTAIPLGLLINEFLTNTLKYAFEQSSGEIYINLRELTPNQFLILMGDNGKGMPPNVNFRTSSTLGLRLMHKLSLQLKGNLEMDNSKSGTHYILSFEEVHRI